MKRGPRSTPHGEHRPVLLAEVLAALAPQPGETVVDCTLGWAGHSVELLRRVTPGGRLIAFDLDANNLPRAQTRLEEVGGAFTLQHGNFAGVAGALAGQGIERIDALLADLGMSSMQVDDAERGFSYARDGPLDMRMDRSRGRAAAELLETISETELAHALREYGDEPEAERVAAVIVAARGRNSLCSARRNWHACWWITRARGPGNCIPRRASGTCIPPRGPFRRCAFWSTASWRISNSCCACCQRCFGPAGGRSSSVSTAGKIGS